MKNYRHFLVVVLGLVCLQFTGARADPAQDSTPRPDFYVEDPLAPHHTTGTTARLGTSVGFLYGERLDALALGAVVAGGKRWGRFALEAEYGYYELSEKGPSDRVLGDAQRLGVISRLEVVRLGSSIVGGNSMLSLYVEGGVGVAWNDWYMSSSSSGDRIVPIDTKRVEGQAGFGIMLDHRLQEPIGFPHRIGWFLGWRLAFAPHETEPASICRGVSCRAAPMMAEDRFIDRSMMFGSSLSVTW